MRYARLRRHPTVFRAMTGLAVEVFDVLCGEFVPRFLEAEGRRLSRPGRRRAIGAGHPFGLRERDQLLLTVVWLRRYPINAVLGYLFGVEETTALRTVRRVLPVLEAAGLDTMRQPDPGKWRRPDLDALLAETPALAVVVDTFGQRVRRPRDRATADRFCSGEREQHARKSQVAVREGGRIVDVAEGVRGPTADLTLLDRPRPDVGALGDPAYVGIAARHPAGLGATPRRKPRGKPRPDADIAYNTRRLLIVVEHTIGRLRAYQALARADRHHRRGHTARVRAIAGLVNRRLPARPRHGEGAAQPRTLLRSISTAYSCRVVGERGARAWPVVTRRQITAPGLTVTMRGARDSECTWLPTIALTWSLRSIARSS